MKLQETSQRRRPRFHRATSPPPFRLTDGDIDILQQLARHRFLRSSHLAHLVGRSHDRTNNRLCRLFHAEYVDRPRAQLDYYPTAGSAPMVYALADRGARILAERGLQLPGRSGLSRTNRTAGRPFIEHQLEVVGFSIALEQAARAHDDICLIGTEDLIAAFPEEARAAPNPLALRVKVTGAGQAHAFSLVPDLAVGLRYPDGSRRCFLVEIDRGTMPISRSDIRQTSIARKLRGYLSAHAARQHERQFGWRTFRVLIVTTDERRMCSMVQTAHDCANNGRLGASLFLFATRHEISKRDPLSHQWITADGRQLSLI